MPYVLQIDTVVVRVIGWLGGVVNAASFLALLYEYIMSQFFVDAGQSEVNSLLRYCSMILLALLLTAVNYRGLVLVGRASTLIYIVSMSAFLVMIIIGIPKGKHTEMSLLPFRC
jgi:amino acid transporter